MSDIKIGSTVIIARNQCDDYGYLLGKTGTVIAGGAKYQDVRRFLIKLNGYEEFYVSEPDLDIIDEMKTQKEKAIQQLQVLSQQIEARLNDAATICGTFALKLKDSELSTKSELDYFTYTVKRILSEAMEELDPNKYHI